MRFILKLLFTMLFLLPFALAAAVFLSVEKTPAVSREVSLSPAEVERAKDLFKQHDPRSLRDGEVNTMVVSEQDLDLAFNYLADRMGNGDASLSMSSGAATALVTLRLPENPLGRYLNVEIGMLEGPGLPAADHVRIGRLPIPGIVADFALRRALDKWYDATDGESISELVQDVSLNPGQLQVTYKWDSQVSDAMRGVLVSEEDQERLELYNDHLVSLAFRSREAMSLAVLLEDLFAVAAEQSADGDPAAENRAVILLLSTYVNGEGIDSMAPDSDNWPEPIVRRVTLGNRRDFAQHFITSAALQALGGTAVSDAIGLFKEVDDSRGGSGFSFNDLCADMAGTRFGEWATSSGRATELQAGLASPLNESIFMPDVSDLPEHMNQAEFRRRFGGVGEPAYNEMVAEIERRIAALPLYQ